MKKNIKRIVLICISLVILILVILSQIVVIESYENEISVSDGIKKMPYYGDKPEVQRRSARPDEYKIS